MILPGWNDLTQEEIIENIHHAFSLIKKESDFYLNNPDIRDEMEYRESEAFRRFATGKLPQIPDSATIDRLYKAARHLPPAPFIISREEYEKDHLRFAYPELREKTKQEKPAFTKEQEDLRKNMKVFWDSMSSVIKDCSKSAFSTLKNQLSVEELQKAVQKHPNRIDLKLELIKLQKQTKTGRIGRPKRKKK